MRINVTLHPTVDMEAIIDFSISGEKRGEEATFHPAFGEVSGNFYIIRQNSPRQSNVEYLHIIPLAAIKNITTINNFQIVYGCAVV